MTKSLLLPRTRAMANGYLYENEDSAYMNTYDTATKDLANSSYEQEERSASTPFSAPSYQGTSAKHGASLSISVKDCIVPLMTSLVLVISLFFAGCSSIFGGTGEEVDSAADSSSYLGLSEAELDSGLSARYGTGSIPEAEGEGLFKDIRFGFDSYSVDEMARERIALNIQVLNANPGVKIQLEGHCDERGTTEYNLALGQRRAEAVRDAMLALGVDRNRIETISYGSEVPLDPAHTEAAWAVNRRVHFTPFTE